MKTAIDSSNLIACLPCAKAKAKCDKRLPTCSRCLQKKLKCEIRQTKRYPEVPLLHSLAKPEQAPQTTMPPSATSSPPPEQSVAIVDNNSLNQFFSNDPDTGFVPPDGLGGFQWTHPLSGLEDSAGDFPMEITDQTFLSGGNSAMAFDFPLVTSGLHAFQSAPFGLHGMLTAPTPSQIPRPQSSSVTDSDENWPYFRCNPPSDQPANPRMGAVYLMRLEDTLNDQSIWTSANGAKLRGPALNYQTHLNIEPIQDSLRDKLMVISQGFLNRARDIHRTSSKDQYLGEPRSSFSTSFTGFFILPPPTVLDCFLRIYASRVEQYLPFFPAATLSATQLVISNDEKLSILLLLLMIAHGAMGSPLPEARHLANGLIETCRICMYDVIEKNVQMASHPVMLRCALLYLNAASWSGTKWHMTFAAAQIRMYLSMVRCSGLLDTRETPLANMDPTARAEGNWRRWQMEEKHNRLIYCWVSLDQEVHLFQDRQQEFDVDDLKALLPESDELWNASSVHTWQTIRYEALQSQSPDTEPSKRPRSLKTLFKLFMSNELSDRGTVVSLFEMRLLLHPLQALIYHLNRSLVYFSNSGNSFQGLLTQLKDVQYHLKEWYVISKRTIQPSEAAHACSTMVMFHLLSLNAISYFPDIERLARGELSEEHFRESHWTGKRYCDERAQIWCHCGQVIRYFRKMRACDRPYWWSACIYRVALCMWAAGIATRMAGCKDMLNREPVAIDTLPFDHPSILRYLRYQDGTPVLSRSDGSAIQLVAPIDVVQHCVHVLGEHEPGSRLDEGISARLSELVKRWKS